MALTDRIVALRDWVRRPWTAATPEPPVYTPTNAFPGAYALFMDADEVTVIYAKPWPHAGIPADDRTNSSTWLIDGALYAPSRRDEQGNLIFRRCVT